VTVVVKRGLVVCTANICRSPVVERLLRRELDGAVDVDGDTWVMSSAGTAEIWPPIDPRTVVAAATIGIDVADHQRRTLNRDLLNTDGSDLILTMTREHLRTVVSLDVAVWPRVFTLLELARRASAAEPASEDEGFAGWLQRVAAGRRAADMMRPDPADDVDDPYGGTAPEHVLMIERVHDAVTLLVRSGPWKPSTT